VRAGAKDVVNDRFEEPSLDDSSDIRYVGADVTDPDAVCRAGRSGLGPLGPVTDVVLLAGRFHSAPLLEQTPGDVDAVFRLNLLGSMLVAQEVSRRWRSEPDQAI
jgi:NAD(P)-dependent dehydrogenase (short-subunit alcohol dehydrogenase family)